MLIYDTKTEHLSNPLGLDSTNPRFSWKMSGNSRNATA